MDGLAIAASLCEIRGAVEGGIVRTVYRPTQGTFVFHIYAGRARRVLISPVDASVHLTELDFDNPPSPSPFVMLLRKHLSGGRIRAVRQLGWDRIVVFEIERRSRGGVTSYELIGELTGLRGNLILAREQEVIGVSRRDQRNAPGDPYRPLPPQAKLDPRSVTADSFSGIREEEDRARFLVRRIDGLGRQTAEDILAFADRIGEGELEDRIDSALRMVVSHLADPDPHVDPVRRRAAFYPLPPPAEREEAYGRALDRIRTGERPKGWEKSIRAHLMRELGRRERTAKRLREWLADSGEADRLRHSADLLMLSHSEIPRGEDSVELTDPISGETVRIRLDPSLGAIENAQRLYTRAKRLKRGRPRVTERLSRIEEEIATIKDALSRVEKGEEVEAGLPFERDGARPEERQGPFRSTVIGGYTVLIGRNAAENDRILREASPDDVWLHARGHPGSHVIVRRGGRGEIPLDVLREAAKLAARRSKGRGERRLEVSMAAVKHVRKPKGAPPGLVIVENEDTLIVELDGGKEAG